MARYSLNLPAGLKQKAEQWAGSQGVSLNQFILWAVAEKVGSLAQSLDDPRFPHVTWQRDSTGEPTAFLRGSGVRIKTLVVATQDWGWSAERTAEEYDLSRAQVDEALAFYEQHRTAIDRAREQDRELEAVSS